MIIKRLSNSPRFAQMEQLNADIPRYRQFRSKRLALFTGEFH
jgi:hypothetical protein